jgi:hypothetical protein
LTEESPDLEKSRTLIRERLSDGESSKCDGVIDIDCKFLPWYDFQKEEESRLRRFELAYFTEFPSITE